MTLVQNLMNLSGGQTWSLEGSDALKGVIFHQQDAWVVLERGFLPLIHLQPTYCSR
jgi:hypothetical protein